MRRILHFDFLLPMGIGLFFPVLIFLFLNIDIVDDAFISYRYSLNLARGNGLVFNPGEYVEGFTNLLWTLIMTLPVIAGLPVYLFAAALGSLFGFLSVMEVWGICRRLDVSRWAAYLAILVLSIFPSYWLVVANGLEAGIFGFLLVLTARLYLDSRLYWASLCGGLLFTVRPESLIVIPMYALIGILLNVRKTSLYTAIASTLPMLTAWAIVIISVTIFRILYYHDLLPNTIRAKSVDLNDWSTIKSNVKFGIKYLRDFLMLSIPLSMAIVLSTIFAIRRPIIWLFTLIFATSLLPILINGGDWMQNYRLLVMYVPILAVMLALTLERLSNQQKIEKFVLSLLVGIGILATLAQFQYHPTPYFNITGANNACYSPIARYVRGVLLPTDKIAPDSLGEFSYVFPDNYSHDMWGLTDKHIARYGVYGRHFGRHEPSYTYYVVEPNFIIVHTYLWQLSELARVSNGEFNKTYSSYILSDFPSCWTQMAVAVRKQDVPRIMPALSVLKPQQIMVSSKP